LEASINEYVVLGAVAYTALFLVWRLAFGPQRKFAASIIMLSLMGVCFITYGAPGGVIFYVGGLLLVLAPLLGIVMFIYNWN